MVRKPGPRPRTVAIVLLACVVLAGLVLATGGIPGSSPASSPTAPAPVAVPSPQLALQVRGAVSVTVRRQGARDWRFIYAVRNTGSLPLAGFEINAARSDLFGISSIRGWTFYGSGICGETHPGILIYWSTGANSAAVLRSHAVARFAFSARSVGPALVPYSLSWGPARPQFGRILGPRTTSPPAGGSCRP